MTRCHHTKPLKKKKKNSANMRSRSEKDYHAKERSNTTDTNLTTRWT